MRIRSAAVAFVLVVAMSLSSAAWAGRGDDDKGKVKIKKTEKVRVERETDRQSSQRWDRGDWTRDRDRDSGLVIRQDEGYRTTTTESRAVAARGDAGSGLALGRQPSGPYRYFFTDHEGKYNYYLDRYSYPYRYGAGETDLPVGVLGYVPPEQIGGGPVRYFRPERPLSRSVFDGTGRVVD